MVWGGVLHGATAGAALLVAVFSIIIAATATVLAAGMVLRKNVTSSTVPPASGEQPSNQRGEPPNGEPKPSNVPPDGDLREKRDVLAPGPSPQDPRVPPWSDQIVAQRITLLKQRGKPSGGQPAAQQLNVGSEQPIAIYRYERGTDLTNDEMGYGQRVHDLLWFVDGTNGPPSVVPKVRCSQLTKTGRQFLVLK
jgi:hypothetical protein